MLTRCSEQNEESTDSGYREKKILSKVNFTLTKIYSAEKDYYIWSNLNICKINKNKGYDDSKHLPDTGIIFSEFNPSAKKGRLKIINEDKTIYIHNYESYYFNGECIACKDNTAVFNFDKSMLLVDTINPKENYINRDYAQEDSFPIPILNNTLYFVNKNDCIFEVHLKEDVIPKFSSISSRGINSLLGFDKFLFIGCKNGWEIFQTDGKIIYKYQNFELNILHTVNKNILTSSKENNLFIHNLNCFQEGETFKLSTEINQYSDNIAQTKSPEKGLTTTDSISSAIISSAVVYALTRNRFLFSLKNDRLNVNV